MQNGERPRMAKKRRVDTVYRPLRGRKYFLHVKADEEENLTKKIKRFGGTIASVLDDVYAVITDDFYYANFLLSSNRQRTSAGSADANGGCGNSPGTTTNTRHSTCNNSNSRSGTGGTAMNRCTAENQSQTMHGFPDSAYSTLSSSKQENQSSQNKYYLKMPSVLRQATDIRVKIVTLKHFMLILQEIDQKLTQLAAKRRYKAPATPQKNAEKRKIVVTKLSPPFLKFEDRRRSYCPVYKQFSQWPFITVRPGGKGCPFERKQQKPLIADEFENPLEIVKNPPVDKPLQSNNNAATIAKPKTTVTCIKREKSGYCDLCRCWADKVEEHIKTEIHVKNSTSADLYKTFDDFIQRERLSLTAFLGQFLDGSTADEKNFAGPSNSHDFPGDRKNPFDLTKDTADCTDFSTSPFIDGFINRCRPIRNENDRLKMKEEEEEQEYVISSIITSRILERHGRDDVITDRPIRRENNKLTEAEQEFETASSVITDILSIMPMHDDDDVVSKRPINGEEKIEAEQKFETSVNDNKIVPNRPISKEDEAEWARQKFKTSPQPIRCEPIELRLPVSPAKLSVKRRKIAAPSENYSGEVDDDVIAKEWECPINKEKHESSTTANGHLTTAGLLSPLENT